MKSKSRSRNGKSGLLLLFLVSCFIIQGCIVVLGTTTAVIMRMDGRSYFTSTVLLNKDPETVFNTAFQVMGDMPEFTVIDTIDENYRIEFKLADTEATVQATPHDSRLTQLILTANAGDEELEVKDQLLKMMGKICEELGVSPKLVDE